MFQSICNKQMLAKCMWRIENDLDEDWIEFVELFVDTIDRHNGLIFGSTITAYMLNSATMNGIPAKDVDIMFPDIESAKSFSNMMLRYEHCCPYGIREDYKFNSRLENDPAVPIGRRSFSNAIHVCINDRTLLLHLSSLRSFRNIPDLGHFAPLDQSEFVKFVLNDVIVFEFAKAVYYKGNIYSTFNTLENVPINMANINTNVRTRMIKRYIRRGVKFTMDATNEDSRIDRNVLSEAKDKYRSLGLVVIPLSRNDNDGAGKAPTVAGWTDKRNDFDFDVADCDNIGLVCGKYSGIVCIDVDKKDQGMIYFDKMIQMYGIPDCPTQLTPNGGRHYIFKYDGIRMRDMKAKIKGVKLGDVHIGIDFWIKRCQFVAEPSMNHSVNMPYKWIKPITSKDDIPELPEWIYKLYYSEQIDVDGSIIGYDQEYSSDDEETTITETDSQISECAKSDVSKVEDSCVHVSNNILYWIIFVLIIIIVIGIIMMIMFVAAMIICGIAYAYRKYQNRIDKKVSKPE